MATAAIVMQAGYALTTDQYRGCKHDGRKPISTTPIYRTVLYSKRDVIDSFIMVII